ncbi:MAG TPA: hypothetical protein VF058_00205, partial [Actinomycetota bacterium]
MGLRRALARVAAGAPTPVFVVAGVGGRRAAQHLDLSSVLAPTPSPRAADALVVAGFLTERLLPAVMLAHDQIPAPRLAFQWLPDGAPDDPLGAALPGLRVVEGGALPSIVRAEHERLLAGEGVRDDAWPDVEPSVWRGIGPYGQGGKGMTGGVPYGRPLPGRADDRDGLKLDRLDVRVGPLFPGFPPGLELVLGVQGDVAQEVAVGENPFEGVVLGARTENVFARVAREAVPIAELEAARARSHLRWLADALRVAGLPSHGRRVLALAVRAGSGDVQRVARLSRSLERGRGLRWHGGGVGVVREDVGGPVARAAGHPSDLRTELDEYRALGFEPVVGEGGD